MSTLQALAHETRFGLISVTRSAFALTLGFLFPFAFLVIFNVVGDDTTQAEQAGLTAAAVAGFTITSGAYFNMPLGVVNSREKGLLRRVRAASPRPAAHLMSRIVVVLLLSAVSLTIMTGLSILLFGLEFDALLPLRLTLLIVLGTIAVAELGLALTRVAKSVEPAMVIFSASLFPLLFVSGVFFPLGDAFPAALLFVVKLLPFFWIAELARWVFWPDAVATSIPLGVAVLAIWTAFGSVVRRRFFSWLPAAG